MGTDKKMNSSELSVKSASSVVAVILLLLSVVSGNAAPPPGTNKPMSGDASYNILPLTINGNPPNLPANTKLNGVTLTNGGGGGGAVDSVFGRTGIVVAVTGDYTAAQVTNAADTTASYSNPSWITGLIWSKITSTPTTIAGYGIADFNSLGDARWVLKNGSITGATKTKITFDTKGLVTSGADATTADIADSTDKRYVTDAQRTVIGNTSGTNTGDQTSVTGNAGTTTALQTARSIYGNNFDGTAALAQIIASTYGGTGNGFTKFSGPTTSEKTKTVRDANDTILELGGSYTPTGTWTSLTMVTPVLGTPASGNLANCTFPTFNQDTTGSAVYWKTSGTGKGAITGPATGTTRIYTFPDSDQTMLYSGGALGTPSSGTLTNATGLPNAGLVNSTITVDGTSTALGGTALLPHSATFTVDGSGTVLTTGTKNPIKIPYGGTLVGWVMMCKPSGSVTADIFRAADGAGLPTTSIVGGSGTKPAVSSGVENSSTSFTLWTSTTLTAKDNLAISLSGISTATYVALTVYYK